MLLISPKYSFICLIPYVSLINSGSSIIVINGIISPIPIISKNDIMSKYTLAVPGDIMKIVRTSKATGNYPFYRLVR